MLTEDFQLTSISNIDTVNKNKGLIKKTFFIGIIMFIISCNNKIIKNDTFNKNKNFVIQKDDCDNIKLLKEIINTDTITFDIGTKLFWNYNCDSLWLTYINKKQEQIILDNWTENPELSVRMGLTYLQDFKKNILFERNVISGCCDLPDNIIFDKKSGKEIINIGPKIWYSENKKYPLVICFENNDTLKDKITTEFEKLVIYNLDTDKKYYFQLSEFSFFKDLKEQYSNYDVNLLEDYSVEKNILILKFKKELLNKEGKYIIQIIKLNLNNYCT